MKKNQKWVAPIDVIHHDAEIYPEPHSFNPERFLEQSNIKAKDNMSFLPFGAGPRNCLGNQI